CVCVCVCTWTMVNNCEPFVGTYEACVCICLCLREWGRMRMCVCVWVCVCGGVCVCVCVCVGWRVCERLCVRWFCVVFVARVVYEFSAVKCVCESTIYGSTGWWVWWWWVLPSSPCSLYQFHPSLIQSHLQHSAFHP